MIRPSSILIGVHDLNKAKRFYETLFEITFEEFRPPFASFIMNGLEGSKKYKLTACINSFDSWPGSVSLRKVDSGGGVTVLASESSDENAWILKTLEINTTFIAGDQLVIRLSAGSTETPAASKYVLFDLIELTEQ